MAQSKVQGLVDDPDMKTFLNTLTLNKDGSFTLSSLALKLHKGTFARFRRRCGRVRCGREGWNGEEGGAAIHCVCHGGDKVESTSDASGRWH